ncbi:hypothetical protein HDU67_007808 [Dinochytrium kinnereticum]|nr:hypothetical protein HDU67_007808 [Dinochytrium kinnereticum]
MSNATVAAAVSKAVLPTTTFDRTNFGILAAGFSLAMILKYGAALTTRRLRGTDSLAGFVIGCWGVYIFVQLVDMWVKRVSGPIENFQWAIASVTILYSITLVAVLHLSFLRSAALSGLGQVSKNRFATLGLIIVGLVLVIRLVRTGFIFYQTSLSTPNASLSSTSTMFQIITLLPTLFIRLLLDIWSLYNLYRSRVKYVEQAGREAFNIITSSLVIEFLFSCLATMVACQEALNSSGDRFAFMDWLLFSWCLASWVEQRPLYMLIFGSKLTTHSQSEETNTTNGTASSYKMKDMEGGSGGFSGSSNAVEPNRSQPGGSNWYSLQGGKTGRSEAW